MSGPYPDRTSGSRDGRPPRLLHPRLDVVDIRAEGAALLAEPAWSDGDRTAKTVLRTESLRIVLTALRTGATMSNDDPDEAIAIHGLSGTVSVNIDGDGVSIGSGELALLAGGDPWQITAECDSLFVMSVGRARTHEVPPTE